MQKEVPISAIHRSEIRPFKLEHKEENVIRALKAIYQTEVERRGRKFISGSEYVEKVAKWLTNPQAKQCLMLYGGVGNGKTTLLKSIYWLFRTLKGGYSAHLRVSGWKMTERDRTHVESILHYLSNTHYCTASEIAEYVRNEDDKYYNLRSARILLIDDVGIEPSEVKVFGTTITPMADIIYNRYAAQLVTIITSNLDNKGIQEKYDPRVWDRFKEMFDRLNFENESYR